jgi:hypothetical protein
MCMIKSKRRRLALVFGGIVNTLKIVYHFNVGGCSSRLLNKAPLAFPETVFFLKEVVKCAHLYYYNIIIYPFPPQDCLYTQWLTL